MKIIKDSIFLFKGVDLSSRKIPYLIADSGKDGPVICLTAALHGDEVTGTAVLSALFKDLEDRPLERGKLIAFPVLNPSGFEAISRQDMFAEADLNRNFPGDPQGSTAERYAYIILSALLSFSPDLVIDLHADSLNSILYTIVDYSSEEKNRSTIERSAKLAQRLGFPWVMLDQFQAGYKLEKCLTGSLIIAGIPAVTVELGAPNVVMKEAKEKCLQVLWDLLDSQGMLGNLRKLANIELPPKLLTLSKKVYTQSSGIIEYRVRAGDKVERNKILGKIRNIYGETIEVLRSPVDGLLISHEDQSVSFPGLALFTIATEVPADRYHLAENS